MITRAITRTDDGIFIARTLAAEPTALRSTTDGAKIEAARKAEILARARAGQADPIEFDARVYRQKRGEPLTPGIRTMQQFQQVRPGGMRAHARSYRTLPFLMAHNVGDPRARAGTMSDSWLDVGGEGGDDDEMIIRHTVNVFEPWGVAGVLSGAIDRFSVHFAITGDVTCSVHGKPIFSACYCLPGRLTGTDKDEPATRQRVFWIVENAQGRETSAVNVPAVGNGATGVESVRYDVNGTSVAGAYALDLVEAEILAEFAGASRAQLREALAEPGATVYDVPHRTTITGGIPVMKFTRLAALLGITLASGADLTEDQALSAVEGIKAERDALRGRAETAEQMVKAAADQKRTAEIDAHLSSAYAAGKLLRLRNAAGAEIADPQEANLRRVGDALGAAELKTHIDAMPARAPAAKLQSDNTPPPPPRDAVNQDTASAMTLAASQLGITAEEMAAARRDLGLGNGTVL